MARTIPRSLAGVVEHLELEGDSIVTIDSLRVAIHAAGYENPSDAKVRRTAYRLQQAGWLGTLRSRNAWEFLPGSRAGAHSGGDRFLEFRAYGANHRGWPGTLAMESAAGLHGLAQRFPEREVLALPKGMRAPKSFASEWRTITSAVPPSATVVVNGLRTWTVEALLVGIGERPTNYRDVAGLAQWLPEAVARADLEVVVELLSGMSNATVQRTAYLFGAVDLDAARDRVLEGSRSLEVAWFGPRSRGGLYDPATGVHDTTLRPFLSAGTGA